MDPHNYLLFVDDLVGDYQLVLETYPLQTSLDVDPSIRGFVHSQVSVCLFRGPVGIFDRRLYHHQELLDLPWSPLLQNYCRNLGQLHISYDNNMNSIYPTNLPHHERKLLWVSDYNSIILGSHSPHQVVQVLKVIPGLDGESSPVVGAHTLAEVDNVLPVLVDQKLHLPAHQPLGWVIV